MDLGWEQGRRHRKSFYGASRAEVRGEADASPRRSSARWSGRPRRAGDGGPIPRPLAQHRVGAPQDGSELSTVRRLAPQAGTWAHSIGQTDARRSTDIPRREGTGRVSVRTVTLMRDVLRIALNQAVSDGAVARNVAALVKRPKPTRRQGPILSPDQAPVFLSRIQGTRLAPVVTIGLALGLRLGEVLGLLWSAVDLEHGAIRVERALETIGKDRTLVDLKSKESRRTVRMPEFVRVALVSHRQRQRERQLLAGGKWRDEGSSFVFTTREGRPLDGGRVTRDLKRLLTHTWMGGRPDCKHARVTTRECADCGAEHLPPLSFQALGIRARRSCSPKGCRFATWPKF